MDFSIRILGSGAALPIGSRRCSAQVVNIRGSKLLIDCAEGTQDGIRRNHIRLQSIATILISHLHGDHFFGMPGLISTMHLCGRSEPLTVVAPKGARQALETYFELTGNHHNFPIDWVELDLSDGSLTVYECSHYAVEAFPLVHSVPTFGFRITECTQTAHRPRVYVYCCDTMYDTSLLPHIAEADLLCLESTYLNEYATLAGRNLHLTVGQATALARMSGASWLLLTHISARFRDPQAILEQAREGFENSIVAADNMQLFISRKNGVTPLQNVEKQQVESASQK